MDLKWKCCNFMTGNNNSAKMSTYNLQACDEAAILYIILQRIVQSYFVSLRWNRMRALLWFGHPTTNIICKLLYSCYVIYIFVVNEFELNWKKCLQGKNIQKIHSASFWKNKGLQNNSSWIWFTLYEEWNKYSYFYSRK